MARRPGKKRHRTSSRWSLPSTRVCAWKEILHGRRLAMECLESRMLLSSSPIISEIQAGNTRGILDTAGVAADWLEIYNPDPQQAVNLAGWSLQYKSKTPWTFPSGVTLGPGEARVIFCD